MERYNSLNSYLRNRFGKKIYKIAINTGLGCPNRDGTVGVGGCIFCSGSGSGDFADTGEDIYCAIEKAKHRVASKIGQDGGYICYFQAFTNTYAPVEKLEKLFVPAIKHPDIVGISIGTRPDCLDDEKITLLSCLNRIKPVFVELGLQTCREDTAVLINRCYDNACFESCVKKLKANGLNVVAHIIVGLPGEDAEDAVNTVRYAASLGVDGIKLQLLHVLRGTKLAKMEYIPLEMEEYFEIIAKCLKNTPKNIVIHRLTGDGDKSILIAPLWSANKRNVLNSLNRYLNKHNVLQGELCDK